MATTEQELITQPNKFAVLPNGETMSLPAKVFYQGEDISDALGAHAGESAAIIIHQTVVEPLGASTAAVKAAVTDTGSQQTITTGITNPSVPRNITATAGGTAGDIKAIQVVVHGTDMADEVISETLPAFTVDTAGTVVGSKAFKTVTSIVIPAHDGTGATTAIGRGAKLGLNHKLARNTVLYAFVDNVKEGTAPTVTVSSTVLSLNTFTTNTAVGSDNIDIYYIYDSV